MKNGLNLSKLILIFSLISPHLFATSNAHTVQISSNSFVNVCVGSSTILAVPDFTLVSTGPIRELNYANMSSSSTVVFSSSPANVRWALDNGFPIFPQQSISLDVDPGIKVATETVTKFYMIRTEGSGEIGCIPIRTWVRYSD